MAVVGSAGRKAGSAVSPPAARGRASRLSRWRIRRRSVGSASALARA